VNIYWVLPIVLVNISCGDKHGELKWPFIKHRLLGRNQELINWLINQQLCFLDPIDFQSCKWRRKTENIRMYLKCQQTYLRQPR
jgi:hypothetical protein